MKEKPDIRDVMMLSFEHDYVIDPNRLARPIDYEQPFKILMTPPPPEADIETFIMPLSDMEVIEYSDGFLELSFDVLDKKILTAIKSKRYPKVALSVSDDPRVESAIDWGDLGRFRMVYKMVNAFLKKQGNRITLRVRVKQKVNGVDIHGYMQDLWIPDKRRWY